MNIGYARVSTHDHNLDRDALTKAGFETIYQEKVSRASTTCPELGRLTQLRTSDMANIYKLDRLWCSLKHLLQVVGDFQQLGVGMVSLTNAISMTSLSAPGTVHSFSSSCTAVSHPYNTPQWGGCFPPIC